MHLLAEVSVLIGQQGPEILSSLHFGTFSDLASLEAKVVQPLETCKVYVKCAHLVKFWCRSVNRVLRY